MNLNDDYNKAILLFNSEKYNESIQVCEQIILNDQNHYHTWNLLGKIFFNLNDLKSSKQFFIKAIKIKIDFVEAYHLLGSVLFKACQFEDSINIWKEAIKYDKNNAIIYSKISVSYIRLKQDNMAKEFAEKALNLISNLEIAYLSLANIYMKKMQLRKMKKNIKEALKINPNNPKSNFDLSYIYFIEKKYKKAYKYFEYRKQLPEAIKNYNYLPFTEYNKEYIEDKTILVYYEQGFGDNIQFARFLKFIPCKKIYFLIQNNLKRLFSHNFPNITFLNEVTAYEDVDFTLPIMSIPHHFNYLKIPNKQYLYVKDKDVNNFINKYIDKTKLNIGIVWTTSKLSPIKNKKNLTLDNFKKLFNNDRVFYSLQIDENEELNQKEYNEVINLGKDFNDFYDTAVAIMGLDLIISVDTAVAHLTGALGKKGIVLNNIMQFDWRWENTNNNSLWYNQLKVFKYNKIEETIDLINKEINEL